MESPPSTTSITAPQAGMLVIDDHDLVRLGLRTQLVRESDIPVQLKPVAAEVLLKSLRALRRSV